MLEAFVVGLSISIVIGQLDGLLGIEVDGASALAKLVDVVRQLGDVHGLSVLIGGGAIVTLALMERFVERIPGAIVVVVVGIVLVAVFGLDENGLAVVGEIPTGLPAFGVPDLSHTRWLELLAGGAALLLVGFSEGYASASAVADRTGEEIDANQELVGAGVANVAAGLLGGMAVGGSLSKSSASQNAGARSQVANLVAAGVVVATLLFLAPVFADLPEPVLAAVVIMALVHSARPGRIAALWRVNRFDFAAGLVTGVLVLVWETLPAMIVGVALSLAFVVRRASFPDIVELAPDEHGGLHRVDASSTDQRDSPTSIVRLDGPLIYANADHLRHVIRALVTQRPGLRRLVLDGEAMSDLDTTGAELLAHLDEDLAHQSIELRLARVHHRVRAQIERSHLGARFAGRIDATISAALAADHDRPTTEQDGSR